MMLIRSATSDDCEALCHLYLAFHEFHVQGVPTRLRSLGEPQTHDFTELSQTLLTLMEREDAALFVAEHVSEIVGVAEVYVREDNAHEVTMAYRYGYLQSLMVSEAHRGQGIGMALVTAVETWAAAKGASEIRLETWEFAAGPLPFYERAGYTTLRRTLVRSL